MEINQWNQSWKEKEMALSWKALSLSASGNGLFMHFYDSDAITHELLLLVDYLFESFIKLHSAHAWKNCDQHTSKQFNQSFDVCWIFSKVAFEIAGFDLVSFCCEFKMAVPKYRPVKGPNPARELS